MNIINTTSDVVIEFSGSSPINRLLKQMGQDYMGMPVFKEYRYGSSAKLDTKFSINKNGEYNLYSNVSRGYVAKCNDDRCTDCARHGRYDERPFHNYPGDDIDNSEAVSDYHQSINNRYLSLQHEVRIKF